MTDGQGSASKPSTSTKQSLYRIAFCGGIVGAAGATTLLTIAYIVRADPRPELISGLWFGAACGGMAFTAGCLAIYGRVREFVRNHCGSGEH